MEKNQIFENIMNRTSVRSYTDMPPLAIVVCGCLDKTLEGTEQEFWQLLHLPKTMIPLNTLIIGYPKNQVAAKDKWKEENISYNKLDGEKFIIQEKEEEIGKEEK